MKKKKIISPDIKRKREISMYRNHGASKTKTVFKDLKDELHSADVDIGKSKKILMSRAREMYKGNSLGLGAIRKIRTNVVGPGLKLKSVIDNEILGISPSEKEKLEKRIEKIWKMWAESTECDFARFSNFYQLQSLVFITSLIDGECFIALPYKKRAGEIFELKIQLIESERCCTPLMQERDKNIVNGVEVNSLGEIEAYWFANDLYDYTQSKKWQRVEAFGKHSGRKNILVVMEKERIGQRRGIPLLAPVMEDILQINRYTKAELMAAVISAYFTVFIENASEETEGQGLGDEPLIDTEQVDKKPFNYELGPGAILDLAEGQKATIADPKRPNTAFEGFVKAMAMQIGTALELPHDVLLSLFSSSYSASRAALLEAWKMYKTRRSWFVYDFCTPIFEEWMDEAVSKGYIEAPGYFENALKRKAYLGCEWYGPTQGQLDPLKEVTAAKIRVEQGFSTRTKEAAEMNGTNYIDNIKQIKIEEKAREGLNND